MRGVKHPWLVKRKKNTFTLLSSRHEELNWRVEKRAVDCRRSAEVSPSAGGGRLKNVGSRRLYSREWARRRWMEEQEEVGSQSHRTSCCHTCFLFPFGPTWLTILQLSNWESQSSVDTINNTTASRPLVRAILASRGHHSTATTSTMSSSLCEAM